ncbi:hypothetical protein ACEUAI_12855 [Aeromonas veronii]
MNDLTTTNEHFDRFERFESLSAGTYWSCQVENAEIPLGMVLLIERIKYADNKMHSVILHGHPRHHFSTQKFTFHVREFLNDFQYEPNGEEIRLAELREIQGEIDKANQELLKFQTDPDYQKQQVHSLIYNGDEKKSLPTIHNASPTISPNMSAVDALSIISVEGALDAFKATADHHLRVAKAQGTWLETKASGIARLVSLMTPFYQEQAVAALAKTNDTREHISELMKGIESLDLYTGKDIHIETIAKGISAPPEMPLTLVQSRLYAQEELAVWVDVFEDFDYNNKFEFKKALKSNPDLVAQIFPTERCVLLMSIRRDSIRYSDDPFTNSRMNAANLESFMLVRDGENIYQVFSPIESHAASMALFPSQGELDAPFRGVDGKAITFDDLRYADRKAGFQDKALHYKRYLILMCGLDSREKLFGHFHNEQEPFALISLDFQNKYFNFIYDDGDGMLPTSYESRMPINTWILNMNKYLTKGSHVICEWRKVVNHESAPHLFERERGGYSYTYKFKKSFTNEAYAITRVIEHKGDLIIEAPLYNYYNDDKRPRNYKVKINPNDASGFICLDMMKLEDVNYYIYNRSARSSNVNVIRMLKQAAAFLADKAQGDESQLTWIADNVNKNSLIKCTQEHVQKSIQVYKSYEGVLALPSMSNKAAFNAIFDICYHLANYNSELQSLIECRLAESNMTPLRLVLSGNGRHYVYAALPESERDDRFEKFNWVRKYEVIVSSRGVRLVSGPLVLLKEFIPSEISLHEWDEIKLWVNKSSVFSNAASKQKALNTCDHALEALKELSDLRGDDEKMKQFAIRWFTKRNNDSSGRVVESSIVIPIGLHLSDGEVRYICLSITGANFLNSIFKGSEYYPQFVEHYVECYKNEDFARKKLNNLSEQWMFCSCPSNAIIPGINLLNGEGKELKPAYSKSKSLPEEFACVSVSDHMSFMLKADAEENRRDRHKIFFPESLLCNSTNIDDFTRTKTKLVSDLFLAAKVTASLNGETYIIGLVCKEENNNKQNLEMIRQEFTNELLNIKSSNTMTSSVTDEFFDSEHEAVEYINKTTSEHALIVPTELSAAMESICTKHNAFIKRA